MRALLLSLLLLLPPQSGSGSIEGRVVRQGTGDAVVRATVLLAKIGGQLSDYRTAVTNEAGVYAFRGLVAGRYRVFAQREDYLEREYGQAGALPEGVPIAVNASESVRDVTITLIPTGTITGRVRDAEGNPARGVWVYALRPSYGDVGRGFEPLQPLRQTDDRGEYRLFGLPPGVYFLSAVAMDAPRIEGNNYVVPSPLIPPGGYFRVIRPPAATAASDALLSGSLDPEAFARDANVETFYPGVTDPADALPLDVRPGATMHVDLALKRVLRVRVVQGRTVSAGSGQPVADVSVSLVPRGPWRTSLSSVRSQGGSGTFIFPAVVPGAYEIEASSGSLRARMPLDVGSQDISDISVVLQPGISVLARVRVEGRNAPENQRDPELGTLAIQLLPGPLRGPGPGGAVLLDGLAPGDYRIRFLRLPPHLYVKSLRLGGAQIPASQIRIDRDPGTLEIVLSPAGASASGIVLDAAQRPVAGSRVAFVPAPSLRTRSDLFKAATTDADGRWEVQGLAPGEYKVFAWERIGPDAWQDPAILANHENRGISVRVGEREKHDLRLNVIPDR